MLIPGNSGFQVSYGTGPDSIWVLKRAKAYDAADRLHRQMRKQMNQRNGMRLPDGMAIPYAEQRDWSHWAIGRIHGKHLFELDGLFAKQEAFQKMLGLVGRYVVQSNLASIFPRMFTEKAEAMCNNAQKSHAELSPFLAREAQELIREIAKKLASKRSPMLIGPCHGDLTFGNVMFDRFGTGWVFDFLDSFLDSPLMDLVKLRQETHGLWSVRRVYGCMTEHEGWSSQLDAELMEYVKRRSWARDWFGPMSAFNYARVFQYSTETPELMTLMRLAREELCLTF